jgi:hypothetical protein
MKYPPRFVTTVDSGSVPKAEMRRTPKIASLASALAALVAPAAAPPIADAADSDGGQLAKEARSGIDVETEIRLMDDGELMSFTVHRISDGLMFPQHSSHSSHASHASHASHVSGGLPGGWPSPPNLPDPTYAPPPAPPISSTTTPPAAPASDPIYLACTRASNGFGVNDIASELEQVYGIPANEAMNIAEQALVSVLTGGPYCERYLGE